MLEYFIHFALAHSEFRIPELLAVCECLKIDIELPEDQEDRDVERAFLVVKLRGDEEALKISQRCILVKSIHALWARGNSYNELHAKNRSPQAMALWSPYKSPSVTFRFNLSSVYHRIPHKRVASEIERFKYMDFKGKIDLKTPKVTLVCMEEYREPEDPGRSRLDDDGDFRHLYFGRIIGEDGATRALIQKFDVKKRVFFGNTSMDAEVSLLMANQAQASPGKLVYDPFAGTGSMLYTAAHFGALVLGSDVDGRQMRGKGAKGSGTALAASQYGVSPRLLGSLTFDVTRNPWRCGGIFDAIVTDPPYGVRAGAKKLGGKDRKGELRNGPILLPDGEYAHTKLTYIPPTKPYELSDLAQDLVYFARYMLKPGGRLVFFLPTVNEDYKDVDIPRAKGMEVVANSLQDFGKWGRRLITMVKTTSDPMEPPTFGGSADTEDSVSEGAVSNPAHKNFRVRYFNKFESIPTPSS